MPKSGKAMASGLFCYNCGQDSHISRFCPKKQKYNRCESCENVCFNESAHKAECNMKNFRSQMINPTETVCTASTILEIMFRNMDNVFVVTPTGDKPIVGTLWFPAHNLQLRLEDKTLVWTGTHENTVNIMTIVDKNEKRLICIDVNDKFLKINHYYKISSTGVVSYNRSLEPNVFGASHCEVKVEATDDVMNLRLKWNGGIYFVDVYPDGAYLKDPIERYREYYRRYF